MEALGAIHIEQRTQSAHLDMIRGLLVWVVLLLAAPIVIAAIYYLSQI